MALVVGTSFTSSRRPTGTPRFPTTQRLDRVVWGNHPMTLVGYASLNRKCFITNLATNKVLSAGRKSGFSVFFPVQLFRDGTFKFLQAF